MIIIYKAINSETGDLYIGQTSRSLDIRIKEHRRMVRKKDASKMHHHMSLVAFDFVILETCATRDQANFKERFYIREMKPFYNKRIAGYGEKDANTAKKVSASLKGHTVSEETRKRISASKLGKTPNRVYFVSPEQRAKTSATKRASGRLIQCTNTGEIFQSQASVCERFGFTKGNLSRHMHGITKTIHGLSFKYSNDIGDL